MERDRSNNQSQATATGVGMISVLANIAYAGMRAQGSQNTFGRFASFVIGFPGTLFTYFFVD